MMFHMKQKGSWESSFLRVRMASRERRLVRLDSVNLKIIVIVRGGEKTFSFFSSSSFFLTYNFFRNYGGL